MLIGLRVLGLRMLDLRVRHMLSGLGRQVCPRL